MIRPILLAVLVSCALAAVARKRVQIGETVELSLGHKSIRVWERKVKGATQTIRFCGPTEKNVACGSWVDESGKPVASGARVTAHGKLVIDKVTLEDVGGYSSPDVKPRETHHSDGSVSMLAPPMIILVIKDLYYYIIHNSLSLFDVCPL